MIRSQLMLGRARPSPCESPYAVNELGSMAKSLDGVRLLRDPVRLGKTEVFGVLRQAVWRLQGRHGGSGVGLIDVERTHGH